MRESEIKLVKEMKVIAAEHPRWGYRRVAQTLTRAGWKVNRKRVERLWRREGMQVPQKKRKRRRLGSSEQGRMMATSSGTLRGMIFSASIPSGARRPTPTRTRLGRRA